MRGLLRAAALLVSFTMAVAPALAGDQDAKAMAIGREIKDALLKKDERFFAQHIAEGLYFVDEIYRKPELVQLLEKKGSWLRRNLFDGEESVAHYLTTAKDLAMAAHFSNGEYLIVYQSSSAKPHEWPWCAIRFVNGKWRFSDLFAHR